jgi:hypothetical protein
MAAIPWIQLAVGLLVVGAGIRVSLRSVGRKVVLLGALNVAVAAAILIGDAAPGFQRPALVACALFLVGVLATLPRASWRAARLEAVLGAGTIIGVWVSYFFLTGVSPGGQTLALSLLGVLAASFVVVCVVRSFRSIAALSDDSNRLPR